MVRSAKHNPFVTNRNTPAFVRLRGHGSPIDHRSQSDLENVGFSVDERKLRISKYYPLNTIWSWLLCAVHREAVRHMLLISDFEYADRLTDARTWLRHSPDPVIHVCSVHVSNGIIPGHNISGSTRA